MKKPLRIAVADDEPDTRDFIQKVLERLGHVVLGPVENGLELVDLCLQHLPDLVITDVRMPHLDGDRALEQIHRIHPVPCIVLSAFGLAGNSLTLPLDTIPWTFVDKPFRRNDLHEAIDRVIP